MKVRYVVEGKKPVAVVIGIAQFRRWVEWIEDLEDSLDLKKARRTASKFVDWEDLKRDLLKMRASRRQPRKRKRPPTAPAG